VTAGLLVAGVTGQLGRGLLEAHADAGAEGPVTGLVRGWRVRDGRTPTLPTAPGRDVELVVGDVTDEHWGLPADTLDDLAGRVDVVVNLAADTDWFGPEAQLAAVNVGGALNGLEVARALGARTGRPVPYVYASTIFTAGTMCGPVAEAPVPAQTHHTSYERSKWLAELYLHRRATALGHPTAIARVAALVGSARDGATTRRNSLYLLPDLATGGRGGWVPAAAGARVDALPRDAAGRLLLALAGAAPGLDGAEFVHVAMGERAPTLAALLAAIESGREGAGPRRVTLPERVVRAGTDALIRLPSATPTARRRAVGIRYLGLPRVFATSRLRALVGDDEVDAALPGVELLARILQGDPRPRALAPVGRDWR
jgi:nucleoside-diphosphate-sugar epimerase